MATSIGASVQAPAFASASVSAFDLAHIDPKWCEKVKKDVQRAIAQCEKGGQRSRGAPSSGKDLMKAAAKIRVGSCQVAKALENYDSRTIREAIHNLTDGIYALPSAPSTATVEAAAVKIKYRDAYYARALAYYLADRNREFERDAFLALQVCDNAQQLHLVRALVRDLAQNVNRMSAPAIGGGGRPRTDQRRGREALSQIGGAEVIPVKDPKKVAMKRQKRISQLVDRTFDWIQRYACLNKDNRGKVSCLMDMYGTIRRLAISPEMLDSSEKNKNTPQQKERKKSSQGIVTPTVTSKTNNVEGRVCVDPIDAEIVTQIPVKKNKVIFFERMIAFVPTSPYGYVNQHHSNCANCFKQIKSTSFACSRCTFAAFCSSACQSLATNSQTGRHQLTCQMDQFVLKRTGKNGYLAFQLLAYCSSDLASILAEMNTFPMSIVQRLLSSNQSGGGNNLKWRPLSFALLMARRFQIDGELEDQMNRIQNNKEKKRLIFGALYLKEIIESKLQAAVQGKAEQLFKLALHTLWFVTYSPFANLYLGFLKRKRSYGGMKKRHFVKCGLGYGPLGGLIRFDCDGNTMRRFNRRRSVIEYVARRDISENEPLTFDWGLPKLPDNALLEHRMVRVNEIKAIFYDRCECDSCRIQKAVATSYSANLN